MHSNQAMGSHPNPHFVLINGLHPHQQLSSCTPNSVFRDPVAFALDSIYSLGSAPEDPSLKQNQSRQQQASGQIDLSHLSTAPATHTSSSSRGKKANHHQQASSDRNSHSNHSNHIIMPQQNMPIAMQIAFPTSHMMDATHHQNAAHLLLNNHQNQMQQQQQQLSQVTQGNTHNNNNTHQVSSGRGKNGAAKGSGGQNHHNSSSGIIEPECLIEENSTSSNSGAAGNSRSGNSSEKFLCIDCGHSFANQYNYTRHRKTHESQPAAVCFTL